MRFDVLHLHGSLVNSCQLPAVVQLNIRSNSTFLAKWLPSVLLCPVHLPLLHYSAMPRHDQGRAIYILSPHYSTFFPQALSLHSTSSTIYSWQYSSRTITSKTNRSVPVKPQNQEPISLPHLLLYLLLWGNPSGCWMAAVSEMSRTDRMVWYLSFNLSSTSSPTAFDLKLCNSYSLFAIDKCTALLTTLSSPVKRCYSPSTCNDVDSETIDPSVFSSTTKKFKSLDDTPSKPNVSLALYNHGMANGIQKGLNTLAIRNIPQHFHHVVREWISQIKSML